MAATHPQAKAEPHIKPKPMSQPDGVKIKTEIIHDEDATQYERTIHDESSTPAEWIAQGKPQCLKCGRKHPPPCYTCENCGKGHPPPCKAKKPLLVQTQETAAGGERLHLPRGTMKEARSGKKPIVAEKSKKRSAETHDHRQDSPPKRSRHSKKNRLCLDCGNLHSHECKWPSCVQCGNKHPRRLACDAAYTQVQNRLAEHGARPPLQPGLNELLAPLIRNAIREELGTRHDGPAPHRHMRPNSQ